MSVRIKIKDTTIAVDLDGTIVDLMNPLMEGINEVVSPISFTVEEVSGDLIELLLENGIVDSDKDGWKVLNEVWDKPGFWEGLPPHDGAIEFVKKLAEDYNIVLVSRAVLSVLCLGEKARWAEKYFKDELESGAVSFAGITRGSKGIVNARYLIEDRFKEVAKARQYSKHTSNYGLIIKRPWSMMDADKYFDVEEIVDYQMFDSFDDIERWLIG